MHAYHLTQFFQFYLRAPILWLIQASRFSFFSLYVIFMSRLSLKSDSPLSTMMVVIPQSAGCLGQLPKVSLALSARTLLYFFTVRWHVIGSTSFHKSSLHPHSLHHPGGQDIQWFFNFILFSVIELGNSRDLFHFSYKLPRTFITQTTLFLKLQILPISPLLSL